MRKLVHDHGNLHDRVNRLRVELDEVQKDLDRDPDNSILRDEESVYVKAFSEAQLDEERFLKQKAKIDWLEAGDSNSAYFHKSVKSRNQRSRIDVIRDANNVEASGAHVADAFVSHYYNFLGTTTGCEGLNVNGLFANKVSDASNLNMIRPVSDDEIRAAMFSIGDDRAPGPDGYTSAFFKKSWDIVSSDICRAVRDFFSNGQMLKEINHTFIALIPKRWLVITFVPGRRISDNILITQELMHGYHCNRGPPRCAFKVDIQKAYDTVDWDFLNQILLGFGYHHTMVAWIMACVKSTSFSISINGDIHGYFKGCRGLRQGDPMSPYIFTLVMEILTLIIKKRVQGSETFRYHKQCEELELVNVCFADDLFIFARGDVDSARLIMEALDEFQRASGLTPSIPKSTVYFCNVRNYVKQAILNIMPFAEGEFPVKYLGVPLISSCLLNKDCKVLVERVRNRIGDWKNKSLSFAGRLQLCKSVLSSMHVYWASVLMIPLGILHDIQQHMRGFLWCNGELKRGKAKVAWDDICLPKCEGGLGLRMDSYVQVTGAIVLGHSNQVESELGWLKLLQIRDLVKPFFWSKIGNGRNTSLLFDNWCASSPLSTYLTPRDISREGFNLRTCVADLVAADGWLWPQAWLLKAPNLGLIPVPALRDQIDVVQWKDLNGLLSSFSVRAAWEALRSRGNSVLWYRVVWFSHCIPRHAFHIWLVMRNSLRTQDKLRQWETNKDSHPHLFFECAFSSKVWQLVCHLADLDQVPPRLQDIMLVLQPIAHKRTAKSVIGRLLLAATSYFIWMEVGISPFQRLEKRGDLVDMVMITVRLKLLTLRFKNKLKVAELLSRWKIPSNFRLYGIVAAGGVTGRIMIWRGFGDLTFAGDNGLLKKEDEKPGVKGDGDVDSHTTWHWHFAEVKFLLFSSDGAYLYYAGKGGVLVVWKLDTGKKFLPGIGTPILRFSKLKFDMEAQYSLCS
ncbi:putative RNA-directed DNA polymerase [Tanacetum coccineum]